MDNLSPGQHYILLTVDNIRLCFSKQDGTMIDLASEVHKPKASDSITHTLAAGFITHERQQWPVYSFRKNFSFIPKVIDENRFCVNFLLTAKHAFGLLCSDVTNIKLGNSSILFPLPACMQTSTSPISHIFFYQDEMMFMLTQDKLVKFISHMESQHD